MEIKKTSKEDVHGFIECHLEIWKSLKGILPDIYVNDYIEKASSSTLLEELLSEITYPNYIILHARVDTETVGLAWGKIREDGSSWLSFMGVSPNHRRNGIGRSLLTRFIEESRLKGSHRISLNTDPRQIPAIKLYEDMAFDPEGHAENSYGMELVIYSKSIK